MNSPNPAFPTPFQDEFFGGVILRFHELYGTGNPRRSLSRRLRLGSGDIAGIPTALNQFVDRIPPIWANEIEALLEYHTIWPFYRPFLTKRTVTQAWNRMVHGPKGSLQLTLGDSTSRLPIARALKVCVKCAAEDRAAVGRPYLHVHHQLPGVLYCARHHVELQQIRKIWKPTIDPFGVSAPATLSLAARAAEGEIKLSNLAGSLWDAHLPQIEHQALYDAYVGRLKTFSLITRNGRLRYGLLADQIEDAFSKELLKRLNGTEVEIHHWVHAILFKPHLSHHPIKHLLMIGTLFGTVEAFQEEMRQMCLSFDSTSKQCSKRNIALEIEQLCTDPARSISAVARQLGLSVTTCVIYAKRLGFSVNVRPKRLTPKVVLQIERLAAEGQPANAIAEAVSVSLASVYRVIRSNRMVEQTTKQKLNIETRKRNRSMWTQQLRSASHVSVTAMRRSLPAVYAWLYRHDRHWLQHHPPRT